MSTTTAASKAPKTRAIAKPSASIVLISPKNEVLMLHRVKTSSAFPSAHVFPGGNLSAEQDGDIPELDDPSRHEDSQVYRMGAIRECFEESGILLAKSLENLDLLLEVNDEERYTGRHAIHENNAKFPSWVQEKGGFPDIDGLQPFTRFITPPNLSKRFTTQMYIYLLPLPTKPTNPRVKALPTDSEAMIANPTSDGGIEHTTAKFLKPLKWLELASVGEVILFPPQYYLLHLISPYLSPKDDITTSDNTELARQREALLQFVKSGDPPWAEKCISPIALLWKQADGRAALGLDKPGPELEGSSRRGDDERVILVQSKKGMPVKVEVAWRKDILQQERTVNGPTEKL